MLEPIKIKSTVEAAIESIGNFIAELAEGETLPGERELAEQLKISRNIAREALQHFRTLGIIESKPKIGAVVQKLLPVNPYAGYMPFIVSAQHSLQELAELRLILESGCCKGAVENAADEDLAQLYELADEINRLKDTAVSSEERCRLNNLDIEFHSAFIRLSRNSLLNSLIPLVIDFFSKHYLHNEDNIKRLAGYSDHFDMIDALKNKDAAKLQQIVNSHIEVYCAKVDKKSITAKE